MSRCTAHILSTSVKFIVKSIKRSYSTIVMSKNRTLVLTVVRHGQTDSNKEKLMQGKFFHCFENKTEILSVSQAARKLFAVNQFQQLDELR